jgi:hypothetical protein
MNRKERAALLRERYAVVNPISTIPQPTPLRRPRVARRKPTHQDHFSYGVAMDEWRPKWVEKPDLIIVNCTSVAICRQFRGKTGVIRID